MRQITEQYNSSANVQRRTPLQLRTCWKNMKVKARKYIDSERRPQVKTGRGPPNFQPASKAVEDTLAVLPPKMYQPVDSDIGDNEPLAQAEESLGAIQDDAVIIQNSEIVEDDMGEILNGREGTSSNLYNSRPHSSLSTENEVSRPYSGCSNRHETYRHQYQTPKKVAARLKSTGWSYFFRKKNTRRNLFFWMKN
ncbi:Myb/SANT-like DNA-binding domain-containing protein 3-like 3 [Homarus americanus]|uniref:Myb/SANT-like DNA-binding domain-containing protein 3-like 3 n=1 Tax=Homarus americanus TaxID=6706 RepID=A0A8J5NA83_HOMAM|nr:Myb/SANT-like DNA-binding domain-containing protein 3-like 3 [Homarus americanus]